MPLLLCNIPFAAAQQFKADSLQQSLNKQLTASERIVTLNALAFMYFDIKPDSALPLIEEALLLAHNTNDSFGIASSNNTVGWFYYLKGNSDTAIILIRKAARYYSSINDQKNLAFANVNLAQIFYHAQKDYVGALEYATRAAATNDSLNNRYGLISVYTIIGMIYRDQKQYAEAITYFDKAIGIAESMSNNFLLSDTYTGLGILFLRKNDLAKALDYFTRSYNLSDVANRPYGKAMAKENLGDVYAAMKDYTRALSSYQYALRFFQSSGQKEDWGYECINVGKMQHALKNYDEAIATYQLAAQLFAETGGRGYLPDLYEALSNTYGAKGDYKNALEQFQLYITQRDSIFSREQKRQLTELTTKYFTEQKEKENLLLKSQNATTTIKLERNRAWLIAAGISCLLLSALIYFIYRNRQSKIENIATLKKLNSTLEEQKEKISAMNTILELRALRARMNPHFIFNCMSSIQECILTGEIDDANRYLSKLSRLLRMVLEYTEMESISLDKELEMLELYLQLESVRMKENFNYTIQVDETIVPEEIRVPALILQPFAENAIWHGLLPKKNNRKLVIEISIKKDLLICNITDNGIGREQAAALQQFRKHHRSRAIGIVRERLNILRERSNEAQTGFEIIDLYTTGHQGSGTRVEIILPVETAAVE
ncbi:MAG: tetratricopeptide repeat protein [Chitinophagales bacterium]